MTWPGPAGLAAASNRAALLMAPRVFQAPEGPAAREARRPHFVRRRASKPARALRTLRRPPHQWRLVAEVWLCALPRSPPVPSGPSGALHTIGAWCVAGCGGSVFGQAPQASPQPLLTSLLSSPNVACNFPETLSNHEFTTLELQSFQTFSKCRPIQLHAIILGSGHMAAHGCRRSFA